MQQIPQRAFGPHITFDLSKCDTKKLIDFDYLFKFLDELPAKIGMTKITTPMIRPWLDEWAKTPGYSGFVMLAESHISFHTFPDNEFVFVDIFSCKHFNTERVKKEIIAAFGAQEHEIHVVERGRKFHELANKGRARSKTAHPVIS